MNCIKAAAILTYLSVSPALLFGLQKNAKQTEPSPSPSQCNEMSPPTQRVEAKHIESKGVGYQKGYTSIEGFFTIPYTLDGDWVPFLDLRGHIFNDGKMAANAGLGIRYLCGNRAWGLNSYYDYRNTHRYHYNQVGFGFESLGEIWDCRLNAYLPVGKKESHLYRTHFHEFKGHSIILSSRKEVAMKGGNAEVGAHALRLKDYQLYAAAGPYYFEREGKVAWGGEARVVATLFDYLRLQVSASYDKVFHGIVQGEAAFTYSFGGKRKINPRSGYDAQSCATRAMLEERALQRVDRNEIVVVTKKHDHRKAIDPTTDKPYTVWFVNNTSHSQGSYESPFNTLADAENISNNNDIIYVYPGDGTDQGMNMGIVLKNGQQLWGAGTIQQLDTTLGWVNVPAHAVGRPAISNTFADPATHSAVYLNSGNNVVSGLNCIDNFGGANQASGSDQSAGIRIDAGLNYLIKNNTAYTFTNNTVLSPGGIGILVYGGGNVTINHNTAIGTDQGNTFGIWFYPLASPHQGSFIISNNLLTGLNDNSGLNRGMDINILDTLGSIVPGVTGNVDVSILNNTCNSQLNTALPFQIGIAIGINPPASNFVNVDVIGNYVNMPETMPDPYNGAIGVINFGPGVLNITFHENVSLTQTQLPVAGYSILNESTPETLNLDFGFDNFGTYTEL